ncbi:MAG: polysaccharide biosynthesis transport protein [Acidobacteriota bacterium]|jgi:capsular exopolysaccharide synthesis family protein|nr:polysaccharide biosynthesis transport protein [Acidobacteriota bacterium]
MMSQDNRLLPLTSTSLDRPLSDLAPPKKYYGASTAEPTHLRDYFAVVLKRKWLILSLVIVITSLVTIQMYRQPPIYEAETTIQIEQKTGTIKTKELILNTGNDPTYWNTQLKLLENPKLARQVIMQLDLQNNPAFFEGQASSGFFASIRRLFLGDKPVSSSGKSTTLPVVDPESVDADHLTPEQLERLEPYEDTLRANLTVEPVDKTSLVVLRYRHNNPEIAMKVADTLAKVFIFNDLQRTNVGERTASEKLANSIAELQLKIQQDTERLKNYKLQNQIPLSAAPGVDIINVRVNTYSGQLLAAEDERKKAKAAYDAALSSPDKWSIPEVQDDKSVQRLRDKIGDLEEKRAALLRTYTKEWPGVQTLDDQITQVKSDLERRPVEVITSLKLKYDAALARELKLKADYNKERGAAQAQGEAQIDISSLEKEIETNKQLYATLFQRQNELDITSTEGAKNVTIATPARLPRSPVGPARSRNIVVAFILSLGVGIGLAFLLDYLDDTLKSVEDVDRYIHLPALALIPGLRNERTLLKGKHPPPTEGKDTTALALIEDVRSPIAEAYRHLRTSLLLSSAGQPPKTILVTSSQPSEGKTTTAVNIAVMLAQTGVEVLIIDCDLRRPRIHSHFNMPNAQGVTNFLSGDSDVDGLMQPYEKMPNLKIMTSGPIPPNPAELLGSDEMRKLLQTMSTRFTHIIVDSPPAISFTDASILSTMVDGVMLVVHGGKSSRAVVRRAKQQLLDIGANIYGIVLNNVKLEGSNSYYYYGYYSSYYEADEDGDTPTVESADVGGARG